MTRLSEAILNNSRGVVLTLHDANVVAVLRNHVDFFVLDCAARPTTIETIEKLLAAAQNKPFLIRTDVATPATLQAYLNTSIDGLILTDIQFATEAEKALAACLYPPEGLRVYRAGHATGYGLSHSDVVLPVLNDQLTFVIEIGHPQTVAQLEEIVDVTGVDGVLVNPQRLAVAMEKNIDATHADVKQALYRIQSVANAFECPFGWEGDAMDDIVPNFLLAASDVQLMAAGAKAYYATDANGDNELEIGSHLRAVR